jgi:hypothetical protein
MQNLLFTELCHKGRSQGQSILAQSICILCSLVGAIKELLRTLSHRKRRGRGVSHFWNLSHASSLMRCQPFAGMCFISACSQPVNSAMLKTVPGVGLHHRSSPEKYLA